MTAGSRARDAFCNRTSAMEPRFVLPGGAAVASTVVLRVAGMPVGAMRRLTFDRSFGRIGDILELEHGIDARAPILSEQLRRAIGDLTDPEVRRRAVGLRRAVNRRRTPSSAEWSDAVRTALEPGLRSHLERWVQDRRARTRMVDEMDSLLAEERTSTTLEVRRIVADPRFRRGLLHSSRTLFDEVEKWLAGNGSGLRRPSVTRAVKYLSRSCMKTSPLSTFTVSGTAGWTSEHAALGTGVMFPDAVAQAAPVLELDGPLQRRIVLELCDDEQLAPYRVVRANPSITASDGALHFLGPPPGERLHAVPARPAVIECLGLLRGGTELTETELVERLGCRLGADARPLVRRLYDIGLLQHCSPVADQSTDPLGDLLTWIEEKGTTGLEEVVEEISTLRRLLQDPAPIDDVGEAAAQMDTTGAILGSLLSRIGPDDSPLARPGRGAVHENAVLPLARSAECSIGRWQRALRDLDSLRSYLAPMDPALPLRIALSAYCAERFGPGSRIPVLILHRAIVADLAAEDSLSRPVAIARELRRLLAGDLLDSVPSGDCPVPRLRELADTRARLRRILRGGQQGAAVVRVPVADLAASTAGHPEWIIEARSVAFYVQPTVGEDGLQLVVNNAHAGYGRGTGRILHQIARSGGRAEREHSVRCLPSPAPILADLRATFAFSLNTRYRTVEAEIDYPFSTGDSAAETRIPVGDLQIEHDEPSGSVYLRSAALDREVEPLHLGMMAEVLLPPVARLLTLAFGPSYFLHPNIPLLELERDGRPDRVRTVPRIQVGQIVLQRRRWVFDSSGSLLRTKGERDSDYYLRLLRRLREACVPTLAFVRVWPFGSDGGTPTAKWLLSKSQKPLYVDFRNWFLVESFEKMISRTPCVILVEEALPGPDEASGPDTIDPSVIEYLVEISDPEVASD